MLSSWDELSTAQMWPERQKYKKHIPNIKKEKEREITSLMKKYLGSWMKSVLFAHSLETR